MSSVVRNLPFTSGTFLVVFLLSAASAQNNLEFSRQSDLESMEEIQELLQKVQLVFEKNIASKVREGTVAEDEADGENDFADDPNLECKCEGLGCSCCHLIRIRRLGINKNCCLKLTYVPSSKEIQVSLTLGSRSLFSKNVPAATQPSPICARISRISRSASACIEFREFKTDHNSISGCSTFKASFKGMTLLNVDLGCFKMGAPGAIQYAGEVELLYLNGGNAPVEGLEQIFLGEDQMDDVNPIDY